MKTIKTGLASSTDFEVLESVMGQMSDGIWENSPAMEKYWKNADIRMINNEICIEVNEHGWNNPYYGKSDKEIKKYFATKVKQVVKKEEEYNFNGVKWTRDNDTVLDFMGGHIVREITVQDAYKVYDILLERKAR